VTDTPTLTSESLALDQAFIPWIFWSFCCELVPTFDAGPGAPNLVPTTASALIRPYPLAVAGEPTRLDLDLDAVTMTFSWSTSRVGGGDFADGTVTTFEMPAFSYPNGYRATVTGGWVTSPPAAPLLTVLAKPGVKTVTVAVKPAGGPG
jgi:endoglycosylceramidase